MSSQIMEVLNKSILNTLPRTLLNDTGELINPNGNQFYLIMDKISST